LIEVARAGQAATVPSRPAGRLTVRQRIFRALCALKGHDMALHLERKSLRLRCLSCGSESRGWDLPLRRFPGTREASAAAATEPRRQSVEPRRQTVESSGQPIETADAARRTA
jgi:hypothetical protein